MYTNIITDISTSTNTNTNTNANTNTKTKTKTKIKMAFLKWFLDVKNGSISEFWRLLKTRCHLFFFLFLVPYRNEEPETKTKTPFLFSFLTSRLERPKGSKL